MTQSKKSSFGQGGFGAEYKPHPTPLAMHFPIMIDGEILDTGFYREEFDMILQAQEGDLITVMISSEGGNLSTGLRFYSLLKESPAHTVAIVESHAHSAASIAAMGCDEIRAMPYAEMLLHNCSYGTGGKHPDIKAYVEHSDKMMKKILPEVYAGFLSEQKIAEVLHGDQVWLFAEEVQEAIQNRQKYLQEQQEQAIAQQEAEMEAMFDDMEPPLAPEIVDKLSKQDLRDYIKGMIEVKVDIDGSYEIVRTESFVE